MSFIELFLVAVGLSMDAFAVALSDGLTLKRRRNAVVIALFFGLFQAGMPMIGYFLGTGFLNTISISRKKSLPPSSAGTGRRLKSPTFIAITAKNHKRTV